MEALFYLLLLLFTIIYILNNLEGYGRRSNQEYIHFLHIALGSLRELDTQLIIAKEVDLTEKKPFIPIMNEVEEMLCILVATLNKLKAKNPTKEKPATEGSKDRREKQKERRN